jgi:hypothetical protein
MGFFATHTVSLVRNGTAIASNLPVTMDPVSLDNWQMQVQGMIPTRLYDVETVGWITPEPLYSDYLIDQKGVKYSMYTDVFVGQNTLQFRVAKYSGTTP